MSTHNDASAVADVKPCSIKRLPARLRGDANLTAIAINERNGQGTPGLPRDGQPAPPSRLTVNIGKRWDRQPRTLTVSFLESTTPLALQNRIIEHLNAWRQHCGIGFKRAEQGSGQVRISLGPGGYWSYLGTDILLIPPHKPTMNLEGFDLSTPESEYRRVVRHEAGHTLGFEHEHMRAELVARIDPQKAYDYFWDDQGWDPATVDQQVLTPLSARSIMGTPADVTSIMCYQLPGRIMRDGMSAIPGGLDINASDAAFAGRLYPQTRAAAAPVAAAATLRGGGGHPADEWGPADDIRFSHGLIDRFNEHTLAQ